MGERRHYPLWCLQHADARREAERIRRLNARHNHVEEARRERMAKDSR